MSTVTTSGVEMIVKNITLSTTKQGISFAQPVNKVILQARTAVDILIYEHTGNDSGGAPSTDYYTLKSGGVLTLDITTGQANKPVFWINVASGTPVVEVIGIY